MESLCNQIIIPRKVTKVNSTDDPDALALSLKRFQEKKQDE